MTHGHEDYGIGSPLSTVYTLEDMAELAVRLGSIVIFDRRGNVIFLENFEGSLVRWSTVTSGSGASVGISSVKAKSGFLSCKMVTGDQTGDHAKMETYLTFPALGKLGCEFSWNHIALLDKIQLQVVLHDGTTKYEAIVRYTTSTSTWAYQNSGGGWTDLTPTIAMQGGGDIFHCTKLVVDFANSKYVRLIANNQEYDLADIGIATATSSSGPFLTCEITVFTNTNDNCTVYIDDVIVTQNET